MKFQWVEIWMMVSITWGILKGIFRMSKQILYIKECH